VQPVISTQASMTSVAASGTIRFLQVSKRWSPSLGQPSAVTQVTHLSNGPPATLLATPAQALVVPAGSSPQPEAQSLNSVHASAEESMQLEMLSAHPVFSTQVAKASNFFGPSSSRVVSHTESRASVYDAGAKPHESACACKDSQGVVQPAAASAAK